MNISGIRPNAGFYDYNSIQNIRNEVEDTPVVRTAADTDASRQQQKDTLETPVRKGQNFGAADYAAQYQPDRTYEMKGAESDIHSLDVERALSDMQKDQVLQQYQFFVGENIEQSGIQQITATDATKVRNVENFNL